MKGHVSRSHRYAYAISHPLDPLAEGMVILHDCDTPGCNNPTHLSQGTSLENMQGCLLRDRLHRKITVKDAQIIIKLGEMGITTKQLSEIYGIQTWQVQAILRGYSWRIARGIDTPSKRKKYQNQKRKSNKKPNPPDKFIDSDIDPLPI